MKKLIRLISITLAVCLLCSTAVSAETAVAPCANSHIAAHEVYLYKAGTYELQICFAVTANAMDIDMIGVDRIILYRSSDQVTWKEIRTYEYEYFPEMMDYDTGFHAGYVSHKYATPGYYYKAYLVLHAESSTGAGRVFRYTDVLQM